MRILAIDGNSILNRAFYGIKLLTNKKGFFTNAIVGFMNIYLKALDEVAPDLTIVAFDLKAPTFRHKKVESYKANRKGMPPELAEQLPVIKALLTELGISVLECEGFEADDILGTVARICKEGGNECVVLSGDRDNLQLINDSVFVRLATTKENIFFDEAKFFEVYGLKPLQLIDLKALMGDSSDNIPGVAGVGEKTALALIQEFHSIEELYEKLPTADTIKSGVRLKLENGKDAAFQSKWLATIVSNAPISEDISEYLPKPCDSEAVSARLTDLETFSLLTKLSNLGMLKGSAPAPEQPKKAEKKLSVKEVPFSDEFLGKSCGFLFKNNALTVISGENIARTTEENDILSFLTSDCEKRTFSAKNAYKYCFSRGKEMRGLKLDAEIEGYLLNSQSSEYSIEKLCAEYHVIYPDYLGENSDISVICTLCDKLAVLISEGDMDNLLYEIEQPLTEVLASMEVVGMKINEDGVRSFGDELKIGIEGLESQIYFMAGKTFNISSTKQLGVVLFEELGLPCKKKTKTGYSTNVDVLEGLRDKHPIIELILQYRQLSKLNSTYVEGFLKVVGDDHRIHSIFKQTETRTGRISSTEPNIQTIPVRKELGRNMRKFFIADDGNVLLDADYSQIELRLLAHLSGDERMCEAFKNNEDIHASTASSVFGIPLSMVTPQMRSSAKAVNFGIVYGIGAFSLSQDIGVSVAEADRYIKDYLANFPKVEKFMTKTVDDATKNGYVTTMFGRRRYIPELSSSNKNLQAFGKRAAMNAPIQGSAADIIKIAMVKVYNRLKSENLDARLILQVHDELIVESSPECADRASIILGEEMQNAVSISVPLTADVNQGGSWYDAKG